MNRAQRRAAEKSGAKNPADYLQSSCTITEAVQIARGVAEDAINDYHNDQKNNLIAMHIQLDILRELVISKGLISEDEFREMYSKRVDDLNKEVAAMREKQLSEAQADAKMEVTAGDVEIKTEE